MRRVAYSIISSGLAMLLISIGSLGPGQKETELRMAGQNAEAWFLSVPVR
jgi:hypothetical protein